MAHALEMQDGQVAFALRGAPAWHGLANVLFDKDEHINTSTMLDSAKLSNWNIQLEEIQNPADYRSHKSSYYVTRTKQIAAAEKILAAADGNVDDEWRAWITGRLKSLIDAGHSQLIRNSWPEGIPTLGSGKPIANHLAEPIEQAVAMIERQVGAEFPEIKPGEVLVERRQAPAPKRGLPDEGDEVGTAETQVVNKHARKLTVEGRTWLGAMMQAAKDANRPVNMTGAGGKKTERRFIIAGSLLALADHADDDLARALISIAIDEEIQPGHDLGDAIGTLTLSEATRLGHLARALNAGTLTPMWEANGVRITGDIDAAIAA